MRYKNNALDRIMQLEATISRLQLQLNRNLSLDEVSDSIDLLKTQLNDLREMISIESDDFEQQFAG